MAGEFEKSFVEEALRPRPKDYCVECLVALEEYDLHVGRKTCKLCSCLDPFQILLLRQLREIDSSLIMLHDFLSDNLAMAGRGF